MTLRVMFVDDDPMIIASTRRQLKSGLPNCEITYFDQATAALAEMNSGNVPDVVFSDMRMPAMNGAEFLGNIAACYPKVVRFALTGESDLQNLNGIANFAHRLLLKPCPATRIKELLHALSELLELDALEAIPDCSACDEPENKPSPGGKMNVSQLTATLCAFNDLFYQ